MSRSRLRTFAIEKWCRFDFDNFQAFIDRRNSSARKLIMYLKQELQSRLVRHWNGPNCRLTAAEAGLRNTIIGLHHKELIASTAFRLHQRETSFF